jgi:hypothetical protein
VSKYHNLFIVFHSCSVCREYCGGGGAHMVSTMQYGREVLKDVVITVAAMSGCSLG